MKDEGTRQRHGRRWSRFILYPSAFILSFVGGCARYEFDVLEPADLACHVGEKSWATLHRNADIDYRMCAADNRLITLVYNRGQATIKLLGTDSAVIDPHGESHPMASATIPPGSYIKLIFPPPPPTLQRNGPTFGVGVGVGGAYATHFAPAPYHYHYHDHYADPFYAHGFAATEPQYYAVYDPNDRRYFDWPGGTAARFLFALGGEDRETVRQEFLIRKVKL